MSADDEDTPFDPSHEPTRVSIAEGTAPTDQDHDAGAWGEDRGVKRWTRMLSHFWPRSLSAPCGSRKTTAAIEAIKNDPDQTKVLFVIPTLDLMDEIAHRLEVQGIDFVKVNHQTRGNVGAALYEEITKANKADVAAVILVTLKAYLSMRRFPNRLDWKIVIDEVPQVDTFFKFSHPRHGHLLLDHIDVKTCRIPGVLRVVPKNQKALTKHLEAKRDTAEDKLLEFLLHLASPSYDIFIDEACWRWFTGQDVAPDGEDKDTLFFVSMLNSKAFRRVTILAANVEHSLLACWFRKAYRGQWDFLPDAELAKGLAYTRHDFGPRARIFHFPGKAYSKARRNAVGVDGLQHGVVMDRLVLEHFGDRKFGYVVNNDWKSPALKAAANAIKIPVKCHGINEYSDLTGIFVAPALIRPPAHMALLRKLGLTSNEILIATAVETYYQCIMRTNLRVPGSDQVVDIILPDKTTAEQIAKILGAPKPVEIGKAELGSKVRLSQVQKNKRSKMKRWYQALHEKWLPDPLRFNGKGNHLCVTLPKSMYSSDAQEFRTLRMPVPEFIKYLRKQSTLPVSKKGAVEMFNSAVYKDQRPTEFRRQDNVDRTWFLILDFDNGKFSKDDFIKLCGPSAPEQDQLSFIICNTFSRSPQKPNKFRVIVFFQHGATPAQHQVAHDYVLTILEDGGWGKEDLVLDVQSRNFNHLFHLPCTNIEHPTYWFFEEYNTDDVDFERFALKPDLFRIEAEKPRAAPPRPASHRQGEIPEDLIEAVVRPLYGLQEGRDRPFMVAGLALAGLWHNGARLADYEVEHHLRRAAGNETKMQSKVTRIMHFLHKNGKL